MISSRLYGIEKKHKSTEFLDQLVGKTPTFVCWWGDLEKSRANFFLSVAFVTLTAETVLTVSLFFKLGDPPILETYSFS